MKAFLLYNDQDFDLERKLPPNEGDLTQDLGLDTLFGAMAGEDQVLFEVAKRVVLSSLTDPEAIVYRQDVLKDCLENPAVVREMYDLAVQAIVAERKVYVGFFRDSPDTILRRAVQVLELFVDALKRLRAMAEEHAAEFRSAGFVRFFAMVMEELNDEYFQLVAHHLEELKFRGGVRISAELGKGNKGIHYVLRRPRERQQGLIKEWIERAGLSDGDGYSFRIADRDESGFKALSELKDRGVNLVANALAQSTDHILSFFKMLRVELAFYIGCLNLHQQLTERGDAICFPQAVAPGSLELSAEGLYDVVLALNPDVRVVRNDLQADNKSLVMITGANQGGKSTFLRSVGLAQLMTQSGMFLGAESFRANVCEGVFTHFKREEDASMESGKLDEELSRMSTIADQIHPNSLVLFNESFASTNEREGSEIGRQVIRALIDAGVKAFFVTHMYDLAHGFYRQDLDTALFLRAERRPDGTRTFKLIEGEPLPTSYGEDSFRRIFGNAPGAEEPAVLARGRSE